MYNLYDDDDDDESSSKETNEENLKTKEKMQLLRSKMENLTITKKVSSTWVQFKSLYNLLHILQHFQNFQCTHWNEDLINTLAEEIEVKTI